MSGEQAAEVAGCSVQHLLRAVRAGRCGSVKLSKAARFTPDQIIAFIEACSVPVAEPRVRLAKGRGPTPPV